jgi:hypothetical protein
MELTKEQKIWNSVVAKAWEDETFKQELVASPLEAIKKFTEGNHCGDQRSNRPIQNLSEHSQKS